MKRVLHVITDLDLGGAETMLLRLLQASDAREFSHEVVSLTGKGRVADRIDELGIRTHAVGMSRRPDLRSLNRLLARVRDARPDLVQTWMYHADLLGGLAARLSSRACVIWGIHNNELDALRAPRSTRWTVALCARLSRRVPHRIICVSRAARDLHVRAGYCAEKFAIVPNGFDVGLYRPDPSRRREMRAALGLDDASVVIGLVARVDPAKDHPNFVRAAAVIARLRPEVRFVLCGEGTQRGSELERIVAGAGLADCCLLLGIRSDVPALLNAFDIATLSSATEAFPLAIGEAMASGVPCVVTAVGDSGYLVGDTGRVVPPRDPDALARGWDELVQLGPDGRTALGLAARARVEANFSLPQIAARYAEVYREALEFAGGDELARRAG